ncbi:MAG: CHASE2 domain-containing protein, partial [Oscillospiraceae bacterium]|nr:CHASE2 domain-containing protein [Oscillospiraceae bacterium]
MKNKAVKCGVTIFGTVIAFLFGYVGLFGAADKSFEDIFYHNPDNVDNNIKIIKIDDKTMNALGDFSDWDRSVYADLMEKLCVSEDVRPAVIGFDILFTSDNGDEADKRFAELCAENGNVVTGFNYVFKKELYSDSEGNLIENAMAIDEKVLPYPALAEATEQGFVSTLMDEEDGVIRSTFVYLDENGTRSKSFVSAIYEKYMAFLGREAMYPTDAGAFSFRYSSGVSEYENISLIDVIDGTVPPQAFDDCVVLVGAYAAGMMDAYYVPVDKGQQMYGVEIHANALQAIMEGKTITAVPDWVNGLIAAAIALVLMLVCEKLSVVKVIIICAVTAAAKLCTGYFLFNAGYCWDNLSAVLMAVLIGIYFVALHYYNARAAKQSIEKAFSKYVAPQVVKEIAKNGTYELKLGGENRNIACHFVDIRGFTPLSESLEPEQVVDILNSY